MATKSKPREGIFTKGFGEWVAEGDTISAERDGFTLTATLYQDDDQTSPEGRMDGYWPSLDPKADGYIGPKSKRTLERQLAQARAVIKAWEQGEWGYMGVAVTVSRNGVELVGKYDHACWGLDTNWPSPSKAKRAKRHDYLLEVANDCASEALNAAKVKVGALSSNLVDLLMDALTECLAELEAELENDPEASLIAAAVEKGNHALEVATAAKAGNNG